jgi:membrane-bound lytic murein transglycosylase D
MAIRSRRGLGKLWWWGWASAVCFVTTMTPRVGSAGDEHFPEPSGLSPAVRLWASIFAEYGRRDVVIHDRVALGLVYEVVRDVEPGEGDGRVAAAVERAIARVRRADAGTAIAPLLQASTVPEATARIRTQRGMRESFAQGLAAERLFRPTVRRALEAEGLPLDLAALPLVESSYHPGRVSADGAVGMWQLMADVADGAADERRDPVRSSAIAARHLRALHGRFGSWPLALTAYNHGPTGVQRARAALGSDDLGAIVERYAGPGFGFASKNFYASFLAARHVLRHAPTYFPDVKPARMVTYQVKRGDTLDGVARRHGVTVPSLRVTNGIRAAMIRPGQLLLVRL